MQAFKKEGQVETASASKWLIRSWGRVRLSVHTNGGEKTAYREAKKKKKDVKLACIKPIRLGHSGLNRRARGERMEKRKSSKGAGVKLPQGQEPSS